ncbi:MAG: two-component regulator propeller domain-containing protein [Bacteroidales bacterium]
MRKTLPIIICLLFSCIAISATQNSIKFNHLPIDEGIFHPTITSLYQDENGTIWFSTTEGFLRYNGIKTEEVFPLSFTKRVGHIYSINVICGNHAGLIYFNQRDNVLEYDIKNEEYHPVFPKEILKGRSVSNIFFYKNALFAIVDNQILQYNEGKTSIFYTFSSSCRLSYLYQTISGKIYVGTFESGIYAIDSHKKISKIINSTTRTSSIFEDSKQNIWFSTRNEGVLKLSPSGKLTHLTCDSRNPKSLINNHISCVIEDNAGMIWIGTMLGLDRFDPATGEISHFGNSKDDTRRLRNLYVRCFMKDKQGTIWLGTFYGGVSYFNTDTRLFSNIDIDSNNSTWTSVINLTVDKRNNIWACTSDKGLYFYDRKTAAGRFYNTANSGISSNYLKCIYYDEKKEGLWIGTFMGGLCYFDIKSQRFDWFSISKSKNKNYPEASDIIIKIIPYKEDILFSTFVGIFKIDTKTKEISFVKPNDFYISSILVDEKDNLWISDFSNKLQILNLNTKKLSAYTFDKSTSIYDIHQDFNKQIWVASYGGGIARLDKSTNKFITYNHNNSGLEDDYVSCLSETTNGLMIAGTNSGISIIDLKTKKSINYNSQNGFPLVSMKYGCIFSNKGEILMGGLKGITSLNERDITTVRKPFNMYFYQLKINNTTIKANDQSGILKEALPFTKSISLNYKQNLLEVIFATDNYIESDPNLFQYTLEGYDKQWNNFSSKNSIIYMNLPSGNYTLKVRNRFALKNNPSEISLQIKVYPPWYASWYAYLFYFVLAISLTYGIFEYNYSKRIYKHSLEAERKDKELKELTHQWKLRFFTNISHEFRTPLTLIIGQLDMLMQSAKITPYIYNHIISIHRNANKMMNLVTELMDFRKQDEGFMRIKAREQNLVLFVEEIYSQFVEYAKSKEINLNFTSIEKEIPVWFDAAQLQKCFDNLISNAFKHTPSGGSIEISIEKMSENVSVSVKDTGKGIAPEFLDAIFEQFYQVDNDKNIGNTTPGTGIGLALAKGIVDLHGGKITVKSELNVGSDFAVILKIGDTHLLEKENVELIDENESQLNHIDQIDEQFVEEVRTVQQKYYANKPKILIVEDDTELRLMLVEIFSALYQVEEAANGLEGLSKARETQPDIILSDLMMPLMSGIEMCATLKNDFETSHIPVVLLTAQTAVEQNIEGLRSGADDYVCKPFNIKILVTRCSNILHNRKVIQDKFTKEPVTSIKTTSNNPLDERFIEKAIELVESNIANDKLDVQMMCSELGLSRTALFTKMKALVGQTPNEFIQTIRLKRAAWMLTHYPTKKIADIAIEAGFSTSQYFSTTFKEHFGELPSEYRKKKE